MNGFAQAEPPMIKMTEKLKKKTNKSVLWDNTKSTMKMDTSNLIQEVI